MHYVDHNGLITAEILASYPRVDLQNISQFAYHSFVDNCEEPILSLKEQHLYRLRTGDVVLVPFGRNGKGAIRINIIAGMCMPYGEEALPPRNAIIKKELSWKQRLALSVNRAVPNNSVSAWGV